MKNKHRRFFRATAALGAAVVTPALRAARGNGQCKRKGDQTKKPQPAVSDQGHTLPYYYQNWYYFGY